MTEVSPGNILWVFPSIILKCGLNLTTNCSCMFVFVTMPSCAICRFEAPSDKHLRMHIETKHDDRVLTCEKCENTCKGGRRLKTHMESHREITYNNCEKRIPYNSWNSHMTKCVGDKKESKCENYPAVFNTAGNLKAHITNKSCEIQCNLCDETLTSAGYLDKHIAYVHKV